MIAEADLKMVIIKNNMEVPSFKTQNINVLPFSMKFFENNEYTFGWASGKVVAYSKVFFGPLEFCSLVGAQYELK